MPKAVRELFACLGSLNFAAAQFPDGEETGFFLRAEAGAKPLVAKLRDFEKSDLATRVRSCAKGTWCWFCRRIQRPASRRTSTPARPMRERHRCRCARLGPRADSA